MVIFFLLFSSLLFADPQGTSVQMEVSKSEFYQGEQITVQFYALSDSPQVEVEVVKFPEFKGYWSENQALRQGMLAMMPVPDPTQKMPIWGQRRFQIVASKYKGLIGSYTLIPMLFKKDCKIEPMKVLLRGMNGSEDRILTHEIPKHTIRPLPPAPTTFQANLFFGAVGNFNAELLETEIGFRDNEATSIRLNLIGQGSFSEINDLPLSLPAIVEPISKRTFTNAHAGYGQKSFEWDVVVHSDQDFTIPESGFYFFNPRTEKYEFAKIPKLSFHKLPPLPILAPEFKMRTRPVETAWSNAWDFEKNPWFWGLQALALLAFVVNFALLPFLNNSRANKKLKSKPRLKELEKLPLNEMYDLAINLLEEKLQKEVRHLSHREMVKNLSKELQHLTQDLLPIIESHYALSYSKEKSTLHDSKTLESHLKNFVKKSA